MIGGIYLFSAIIGFMVVFIFSKIILKFFNNKYTKIILKVCTDLAFINLITALTIGLTPIQVYEIFFLFNSLIYLFLFYIKQPISVGSYIFLSTKNKDTNQKIKIKQKIFTFTKTLFCYLGIVFVGIIIATGKNIYLGDFQETNEKGIKLNNKGEMIIDYNNDGLFEMKIFDQLGNGKYDTIYYDINNDNIADIIHTYFDGSFKEIIINQIDIKNGLLAYYVFALFVIILISLAKYGNNIQKVSTIILFVMILHNFFIIKYYSYASILDDLIELSPCEISGGEKSCEERKARQNKTNNNEIIIPESTYDNSIKHEEVNNNESYYETNDNNIIETNVDKIKDNTKDINTIEQKKDINKKDNTNNKKAIDNKINEKQNNENKSNKIEIEDIESTIIKEKGEEIEFKENFEEGKTLIEEMGTNFENISQKEKDNIKSLNDQISWYNSLLSTTKGILEPTSQAYLANNLKELVSKHGYKSKELTERLAQYKSKVDRLLKTLDTKHSETIKSHQKAINGLTNFQNNNLKDRQTKINKHISIKNGIGNITKVMSILGDTMGTYNNYNEFKDEFQGDNSKATTATTVQTIIGKTIGSNPIDGAVNLVGSALNVLGYEKAGSKINEFSLGSISKNMIKDSFTTGFGEFKDIVEVEKENIAKASGFIGKGGQIISSGITLTYGAGVAILKGPLEFSAKGLSGLSDIGTKGANKIIGGVGSIFNGIKNIFS